MNFVSKQLFIRIKHRIYLFVIFLQTPLQHFGGPWIPVCKPLAYSTFTHTHTLVRWLMVIRLLRLFLCLQLNKCTQTEHTNCSTEYGGMIWSRVRVCRDNQQEDGFYLWSISMRSRIHFFTQA